MQEKVKEQLSEEKEVKEVKVDMSIIERLKLMRSQQAQTKETSAAASVELEPINGI